MSLTTTTYRPWSGIRLEVIPGTRIAQALVSNWVFDMLGPQVSGLVASEQDVLLHEVYVRFSWGTLLTNSMNVTTACSLNPLQNSLSGLSPGARS